MTDSYQENESAVCQPTTNQADKETDEHVEWKTPRGDNQPSVCLKEGMGVWGGVIGEDNSQDLYYCICVCVCVPLIPLAGLIPYHLTVQPRLC